MLDQRNSAVATEADRLRDRLRQSLIEVAEPVTDDDGRMV